MSAILIWTLLDRSIDVMIAQGGGEGEYVPSKLYIFLCKPSSMGRKIPKPIGDHVAHFSRMRSLLSTTLQDRLLKGVWSRTKMVTGVSK